jgi:chromate transporter
MTARAWMIGLTLGAVLLLAPLGWNADLARLDLALMKLGSLAFGGGFTLIPLLQRELVERWGWLTTRELVDGIALGQVTPGPIMITATFAGYRIAGVAGAAMATVAVFLPSFLVLLAALPRYDRIKRSAVVQAMVHGVLAAFVALLVFILFRFGHAALMDWKTALIATATAAALWYKVDLFLIVAAAAGVSIVLL